MIYLFIFLGALLLSFYFSGSEAGFVSFNRERFSSDLKLGNRQAIRVKKYVENISLLLIITLLGNNLFNIIAITSFNRLWIDFLDNSHLEYFLLVSTFLLLIIGEVIPKIVFKKWSRPLIYETGSIIKYFHSFFRPIIFLIHKFIRIFLKNEFSPSTELTKNDFINLLEKEYQQGAIKNFEKDLVENFSLFSNIKISQLLTPLIDLFMVQLSQDLASVREIIAKQKINIIPVYDRRIDNIVGYVSSLDIFMSNKKDKLAKNLLIEGFYIPDNISLDKLYTYLLERDIKVFIVVNEYGGCVGIIKREDIVDNIFGFKNLTNGKSKNDTIIKKEENIYWVDTALDIADFSKFFNTQIKKTNFQTLGGFLNSQKDSLPLKNEILTYKKLTFKILEVTKTSVEKVEVIRNL